MSMGFKYGGVLEKFNGLPQNQQITKGPEIGLVIKVHKRDKKTRDYSCRIITLLLTASKLHANILKK
jgi:hypothetical protein